MTTIPDGIPSITCTLGPVVDYNLGDPAGAKIQATLYVDRAVVHAASGWRFSPADRGGVDLPATVFGGQLSFDTIPVDADGFIDADTGLEAPPWLYTLVATFSWPDGRTRKVRKAFQPFTADGPTVDLDLIADDAEPVPAVEIPRIVVTSVVGEKGDVTAEQIDADVAALTNGALARRGATGRADLGLGSAATQPSSAFDAAGAATAAQAAAIATAATDATTKANSAQSAAIAAAASDAATRYTKILDRWRGDVLATAFYFTGAPTYDANGVVSTGAIAWPDGGTGTYTVTGTDANGAVTSFTASTTGGPVGTKTATVTIPRDSNSRINAAMTLAVA